MSCWLLDLPNELVADILEHIKDTEDIRSIAQVCSRLQDVAEPRLYDSIFHRTGVAAVNLKEAVEGRPERASYIQIIDSRCKWPRRNGLIALGSIIAKSHNLRELTIESPYCKNAYGQEAEIWKETMYQLLRPICSAVTFRECPLTKMTLHLNGNKRFWTVDSELSMIFAHPSIKSLNVSCAELHEDGLQGLKETSRTPLQQLTFIECNFTIEALRITLAVPQALSELYLGENCNHQWSNSAQFRDDGRRHVNRLCSTDPEGFFQSLAQQRHCLKKLSYVVKGPSLRQIEFPETCNGLTEFHSLAEIELDGYCPYFEKAMALKRTAPPNLKSLVAKGDMFRLQCNPNLCLADDYQNHVSWTIASMKSSPHLENVRLVSSRTFTNVSNNHREAVKQLGQAFLDGAVSMQLYKRTYHGNIPPFLYGETECTEELVYDTDGGFCEGLNPSKDRALNDIDF